ncbi:MAG TPA: quinone-dependent dihydroorotate dehydrogenase [Saprospiraceae bacterium]|nr:quinone-dependent dihydroorotate dehydrogenase [Saprospiraceae bacterium]
MIWRVLKRFFFLFDPERAHYLSMDLLAFGMKIPVISYFLKKSFKFEHPQLSREVDGLVYKNPVGLAAGFDKDGRWLNLLQDLGFGSIEVGTVTPLPQEGNPKPRLFRLVKDESIINRMGFNNEGVEKLVKRLKKFKETKNVIIGGNIGKNKATPNQKAVEDYLICFRTLFDHVDYFVVNVSSPNTANLRSLQEREPLLHLLSAIQKENLIHSNPKPIYLKIAPDLSQEAVEEIIQVVKETGINGLVLCNTTIRRPEYLKETELLKETGGLSGKAVRQFTDEVLQWVRAEKSFTIIAVGGILDPEDAINKVKQGADLIQIYSGMIYRGPWMVRKIKEGLLKRQ